MIQTFLFIVYDIVSHIERKINYFILFYFYYFFMNNKGRLFPIVIGSESRKETWVRMKEI